MIVFVVVIVANLFQLFQLIKHYFLFYLAQNIFQVNIASS